MTRSLWLALVILTGIAGAALARQQGLSTLARFRDAMAEGRLPHEELVEGVLVLVAGAVLLTPGLLTDVCGFLLLVPGLRRKVGRQLIDRLGPRAVAAATGAPPEAGSRIDAKALDVEFWVDESED